MPHKLRLHPSRPIKRLLKRKDHHHPVHPLLHPPQPPPLPRPELRTHKINHRHAELLQLPRQPKIHIRKINQHRHIRPLRLDRRHQPADTRHRYDGICRITSVIPMMRHILGPHHPLQSRPQPSRCPPSPKNCAPGRRATQLGDQLRPIVVAARLAGREKDARIGS